MNEPTQHTPPTTDSSLEPHDSSDSVSTEAWHITSRWLGYEGEIRSCVVRIVLLVVMYAIQLYNYLLVSLRGPEDIQFHRQVTWIVAIWLLVSLADLIALRRRFFPAWLAHATILFDALLLTAVACLGSSADSPLVSCYFLLIAMAGLRANLPCVWLATLASMIGYLALVGVVDQSWFDENHEVPLVTQFVTLASLAGIGIVVGQVVRMHAESAQAFKARIEYLEQFDKGRTHEGHES